MKVSSVTCAMMGSMSFLAMGELAMAMKAEPEKLSREQRIGA